MHKLIILTFLMVFAISCGGVNVSPTPTPEQDIDHHTDEYMALFDLGNTSMEERIGNADAIARVTLQSMTAGSVLYQFYEDINGNYLPAALSPAVEFNFTALEYLHGTGDEQITGIVVEWFSSDAATTGDATTRASALIAQHDTQWDNREAIVFLEDLPDDDRYLLGGVTDDPFPQPYNDYYSISSARSKRWLPENIETPPGASGESGSQKLFLLDIPTSGSGAGGAGGASGPNTITIGELKGMISTVNTELSSGDGTEAYRECILLKYGLERLLENDAFSEPKQYNSSIESGMPKGTLAHLYEYSVENERDYEPDDSDQLLGEDAHLFILTWPGKMHTVRPLPAGEYRFFFDRRAPEGVICDAQPDELSYTYEVILTVTAQEGVLHEAFFDPQTIESGDGYISSGDFSTGDLSDTDFTAVMGNVSTSITALTGDSSTVTLSLSPYNALAGHTLDFITGDGTTTLSLTASEATGDATTGTLTWAVSDQPWYPGDELMLRITEPEPGVRVHLSPMELFLSFQIADMVIEWMDAETCTSRYLIRVYEERESGDHNRWQPAKVGRF